ncbi:MAG: transporter substrate-binding domain-containing protein [Gammaproteobacteria bacterium]|nr:transporter substrate-binding domain-containing protein [Gammaproteobacteria bacterium]MBU2409695.1 transporter substrate-binding domain-containing protein [Gammaproteobacteria bacterium]
MNSPRQRSSLRCRAAPPHRESPHGQCACAPFGIPKTVRRLGAGRARKLLTPVDKPSNRRTTVKLSVHRIACLLAAGLLATGAAQAQSALDNIMKSKTIKIAIPTDYPPYGSVDTSMKPQGLDVDMAELIAKKMGVKVDLVPVTSANRIPYLQTKKADLVISTLGKNAEREKVIDFSAAYAPFFQGVFGPKSMTIKSFADMGGKSVAVTRGAMEDQELGKVAPPTTDFKRFEDNNATIAAFVAGQTQTLAASGAVAAELLRKNPQLNAEYKLLLKDSPCFVGIAKGDDKLKAKVDEIIAAAKKDGTLDAMAKKWLGREAGDLPL